MTGFKMKVTPEIELSLIHIYAEAFGNRIDRQGDRG